MEEVSSPGRMELTMTDSGVQVEWTDTVSSLGSTKDNTKATTSKTGSMASEGSTGLMEEFTRANGTRASNTV